MATVQLTAEMIDNASPDVKRLNNNLESLSLSTEKLGKMQARMAAKSKQVSSAMSLQEQRAKALKDEQERLRKKQQRLEQNLKSLASGFAAGAAAMVAAGAAAKKAFDFAAQGAEVLRLQDAGNRLAESFDQDMTAIVTSIRSASGGTISRMEAMAAANKALQLGVAQTPEEFANLTRSSVALGRAMGRSASQSIDDVVTGIGRMSPLILDNIGITTEGGRVYERYADSLGKAADDLTDAEKKQALLNTAVESSTDLLDENGDLIDDEATNVEQLTAAWQDYIDVQKTRAAESGVFQGATGVVGAQLSLQAELNRALQEGIITREDQVEILKQVRGSSIPLIGAFNLLTQGEERAAVGFEALNPLLEQHARIAKEAADADRNLGGEVSGIPSIAPDPETEVKPFEDQRQAILDNLEARQLLMQGGRDAAEFGVALNESLNPAQLEGIGAKIGGIISGDTFNNEGTSEALGTIKSNLDDIGTEQPTLDLGLTDDQRQIHDIRATLDALPREIDIKINYLNSGLGGPGFASGGQFVVPPGYPNDSFPMRVSSGETVTVEPNQDNRSFTFNNNFGSGSNSDIVSQLTREFRRT